MIELRVQCQHRWRNILPLFGVETSFLSGKHGPCPVCGGKDRFRFDDRNGEGSWYCNGCEPHAGSGVDLVMNMTGMTFVEAAAAIREKLGEAPVAPPEPQDQQLTERDARTLSSELWRSGVPIEGTEADTYLALRGIKGPFPDALRYCERTKITGIPKHSTMPAMLALVSDKDGKPIRVHRTYLWNGRKAEIKAPRRLMPGRLPDGASIRLGQAAEVMGVAEGVETALAANALHQMPVWSVLNTSLLTKFEPPEGVQRLVVYADNDSKFAGQRAAFELANRLSCRKEPVPVDVKVAPIAGGDWNDVLMERMELC